MKNEEWKSTDMLVLLWLLLAFAVFSTGAADTVLLDRAPFTVDNHE